MLRGGPRARRASPRRAPPAPALPQRARRRAQACARLERVPAARARPQLACAAHAGLRRPASRALWAWYAAAAWRPLPPAVATASAGAAAGGEPVAGGAEAPEPPGPLRDAPRCAPLAALCAPRQAARSHPSASSHAHAPDEKWVSHGCGGRANACCRVGCAGVLSPCAQGRFSGWWKRPVWRTRFLGGGEESRHRGPRDPARVWPGAADRRAPARCSRAHTKKAKNPTLLGRHRAAARLGRVHRCVRCPRGSRSAKRPRCCWLRWPPVRVRLWIAVARLGRSALQAADQRA